MEIDNTLDWMVQDNVDDYGSRLTRKQYAIWRKDIAKHRKTSKRLFKIKRRILNKEYQRWHNGKLLFQKLIDYKIFYYKDSYKFSLPSIEMIPISSLEQPKMEIVYLDYNYNE